MPRRLHYRPMVRSGTSHRSIPIKLPMATPHWNTLPTTPPVNQCIPHFTSRKPRITSVRSLRCPTSTTVPLPYTTAQRRRLYTSALPFRRTTLSRYNKFPPRSIAIARSTAVLLTQRRTAKSSNAYKSGSALTHIPAVKTQIAHGTV